MGSKDRKEASILSARELKILTGIAEVFFPPGGAFEPGARDVDLNGLFNRFGQGFDRITLLGFRLMLGALWYLPVIFLGKPRTFGKLSSREQIRYLLKFEKSRLYSLRGIFMAVKAFLSMLIFSDEQVEKSIGYEPHCAPVPGVKTKTSTIKQGRDLNSDLNEQADICIIGSGAGGAVAAKELAEAGFNTIVLEQGGYYAQEDFGQKPIDAIPRLYLNNSFIFSLGSPVVALSLGKAIGGSTTINSCTCFRVPEEVLAEWEEEYHLKGLTMKELLPFFQKVEEVINVQPGDMEVIGKNALMTRKGATAMGLSHGPIRRNTRGCKGCGLCNYGCPEGAKQSMERSYLPLAAKAGARIFADCRVDKIITENGRAVGVQGKVLERSTGKAVHQLAVKAKVIIVACGAVLSPVLLLKNRLGNQNGQVGKHLRVHPCARVAGVFEEEIANWKGIMQSYYVDSYQKDGIMVEATGLAPCLGSASLPFFGQKFKELMAHYKNIVNLGLLISDSSEGRVRVDPIGKPLLTYQLNQEDFLKTLQGIRLGAEILFAAGAKSVLTGLARLPVIESPSELGKVNEKLNKKTDLEYMAFHPMGTCRMGDDPKAAVVNRYLESHYVKNLFVSDASIFPTSLGVNPQLSIMAFATYLADYLKANQSKYLQ